MKLTIIAPDHVFEHEVDPSMEVQDVQALIAAEADVSLDSILLSSDSGEPLSMGNKSLESYGLKGDSTLFLTFTNQAASSSSSSSNSTLPLGFPSNDADLERMRLTALGNPDTMRELWARDPEMAEAVSSGTKFKQLFLGKQVQSMQAQNDKDRYIEALNADPYDIEAQKKIEEAIRLEAVMENMSHAMEHSPEAFGSVHMLYVNLEINGHPVKAFVDSGAQATIISPECAERCGIMRLLDTRFAGMAVGVGTARILGRVHSAQIRLGNLFLPCGFTVLEGKSVDILFGLDMLKRYQCSIDLKANVLRIGDTEVPFLAEHELPDKAKRTGQEQVADDLNQAAGEGLAVPSGSGGGSGAAFPGSGQPLGATPGPAAAGPSRSTAGPSKPSGSSAPSAASSHKEVDIQTLIGLGAPRDQAIQLLDAAGGNVDVAASMLFG